MPALGIRVVIVLATTMVAAGCRSEHLPPQTLETYPPSMPVAPPPGQFAAGHYQLVRHRDAAPSEIIYCFRSLNAVPVGFDVEPGGRLFATSGSERMQLEPGVYAWRYIPFDQNDWNHEHYWSSPGKVVRTIGAIVFLPVWFAIELVFPGKSPF